MKNVWLGSLLCSILVLFFHLDKLEKILAIAAISVTFYILYIQSLSSQKEELKKDILDRKENKDKLLALNDQELWIVDSEDKYYPAIHTQRNSASNYYKAKLIGVNGDGIVVERIRQIGGIVQDDSFGWLSIFHLENRKEYNDNFTWCNQLMIPWSRIISVDESEDGHNSEPKVYCNYKRKYIFFGGREPSVENIVGYYEGRYFKGLVDESEVMKNDKNYQLWKNLKN